MSQVVIGVDPGGEKGVTALVRCEGWQEKAGRWPRWLPATVEVILAGTGWKFACDRLTGAVTYEVESLPFVAIEDVPAAQAFLKSTIQQVGALRYAAHPAPTALVQASTVRAWLLGGKAPKGKGDALVDQAILEAYGGVEEAVGGKKCPTCGGKGRRGRAPANQMFNYGPNGTHILAPNPHLNGLHWEGKTLEVGVKEGDEGYDEAAGGDVQVEYHVIFHGGRWYRACGACQGQKESPRGPLYGLWEPENQQHARAALAVALYCYNNDVWRTP